MMGCKNLYVVTDHSVLVTVLGDQSVGDMENPRLARIKDKTLWWQFKRCYLDACTSHLYQTLVLLKLICTTP